MEIFPNKLRAVYTGGFCRWFRRTPCYTHAMIQLISDPWLFCTAMMTLNPKTIVNVFPYWQSVYWPFVYHKKELLVTYVLTLWNICHNLERAGQQTPILWSFYAFLVLLKVEFIIFFPVYWVFNHTLNVKDIIRLFICVMIMMC